MTESNSVELFNVEFVLTEKLTLKVEIPLFGGFVHPSDFPKSGGDPVYSNPNITKIIAHPLIYQSEILKSC